MNFNKFQNKLSACRGTLTKTINALKTLANESPINYENLNIKLSTIKSQNERLEVLNNELDEYINELDDAQHNTQCEKIEKYRCEFYETVASCELLLQKSQNQNTIDYTQINARLPKLELPTFSGDVLKWQEFHDSFKIAVDSLPLNDIQKLQYLKNSLKSEAAALLEGLPLTSDNYEIALSLLKDRYGSKRRCVRAHIRSLINLQSPNIKNFTSLRTFIDSVNKHTRVLNSFDVASENYDIFLVEILLTKLPNEIKHEWAKIERDDTTFTELINIIEKEAKLQEIIISTNNTSNFHSKIENKQFDNKYKLNKSFIATSSNTNFQKVIKSCQICKLQNHSTYQCKKLLDKTPFDRIKLIKSSNLCTNCLQNHNISICKSLSVCKICKQNHNTLLHIDKQYDNKQQTISQESTVNLANCNTSKLLPVITIPVSCKTGTRVLGALLDTGSDRSFIREDVLQEINYTTKGQMNLNIQGFGNGKISETCQVVEVGVEPVDIAKFSLELCVSNKMNKISYSSARVSSEIIKTLGYYQTEQPSKIDIIIGSDNYYKLATGKTNFVSNELRLIDTKLGPTLHGVYKQSKHCNDSTVLFTSTTQVDDSFDLRLFWDNELAGIIPKETLELDDLTDNFNKTISYNNQRYSVSLPWIKNLHITSNYKCQALFRLRSTVCKLKKTK